MTKKYVLAGTIAGFLAAANVAYAPIMKDTPKSPPISIAEIKNKNLIRDIMPEDIGKKAEQEEEFLMLAYKEIQLIEKDRIYRHILDVYKNLNVPEYITKRFVRAQIWAESWDYPKAIGNAGERGLMQIMPNTWKKIEPGLNFKKNAFNPHYNINAGIKHLISLDRQFQERYTKWEELNAQDKRKLIAAAYNCGFGGVIKSRYNLKRVPETTKRYVRNIERLMSEKYEEY